MNKVDLMSRFTEVVVLVTVMIFMFPSSTFAGRHLCTGEIRLIAESPQNGSTAHLVGLENTSCNTICRVAGTNRMYLDFDEQMLFAYTLAASQKGGSYGIEFEDAAPVRGSVTHGQVACRLEAIWR